MADHFHIPVSPVPFKTKLTIPHLGAGPLQVCPSPSAGVSQPPAGVLWHRLLLAVTSVSLHRRWVVVPGPRGADS